MNTILVLHETFTNGYAAQILNLISFAAILSGILVIISKNPVVSVLFLIGLFLSISSYLLVLGINFIGLSYLLVYVGAVSILFIFILMLINVRISELHSNPSNSLGLAILITIAFYYPLSQVLPYGITGFSNTVDLNHRFHEILSHNYSDYNRKFLNILGYTLDMGVTSYVTSKL